MDLVQLANCIGFIDSLNVVVDSLKDDALSKPGSFAIESGGFTELVAFSRNCDESGTD
jgi:hypothetical protein